MNRFDINLPRLSGIIRSGHVSGNKSAKSQIRISGLPQNVTHVVDLFLEGDSPAYKSFLARDYSFVSFTGQTSTGQEERHTFPIIRTYKTLYKEGRSFIFLCVHCCKSIVCDILFVVCCPRICLSQKNKRIRYSCKMRMLFVCWVLCFRQNCAP